MFFFQGKKREKKGTTKKEMNCYAIFARSFGGSAPRTPRIVDECIETILRYDGKDQDSIYDTMKDIAADLDKKGAYLDRLVDALQKAENKDVSDRIYWQVESVERELLFGDKVFKAFEARMKQTQSS